MKPNKYAILIGGWLIAILLFDRWVRTTTAHVWAADIYFALPVVGGTLFLGVVFLWRNETRNAANLSAASLAMYVPFFILVPKYGLDHSASIGTVMYVVLFLWPYSIIVVIIGLTKLSRRAPTVELPHSAVQDDKVGADPDTVAKRQNTTAENGGGKA